MSNLQLLTKWSFYGSVLPLFLITSLVSFRAGAQCNCDFTIPAGSGTYTFDGVSSGVKPGDVICLAAGSRERIIFNRVIGDKDNYVTIINCGGRTLLGGPAANNCIIIGGSRYIHITGTGDASEKYGIMIVGNAKGQGIVAASFSSDIEIDHTEITKVDFAGIMIKTDPSSNCADKAPERPNFTMYNISLHDNYIHDIAGEGIYLGNSFFAGTTVYCGQTQYCHEVRGVRVYNNRMENTGWESIQVGAAVQDVEIYNNTIYYYGKANRSSQNGGIQMGLGATGKCYNNFIKGLRGQAGTAIVIQGIGDITVFNNVVVDAGTSAINVNTRPTPLATDIVPNGWLGPIRILNNTIVNPYETAIIDYLNTTPGNLMYNNLIVGAPANWDLTKPYYDWTKGNNLYIPLLADALFVNPSGDDYRLQNGSPAVNLGRDVSAYGVTFDGDSLARPVGAAFDVGAYELGGKQNPKVTVGAVAPIYLPLSTAVISGTAIDPDGTVVSLLWTKESGPAATLVNETTSNLTVNNLVEGVYIFRLTATDNDGDTGYAEVTVTVLPALVNQAPVANAGADKTITLPTNSTTLNGSASDADGTVVSYSWTQTSGPAANMANANTATLSLSNLVEGTYVFQLMVTDDDGDTDTDDVTVIVQPAAVNQNPAANAGSDKTLQLPTNSVNLAGSGSDADGTITTYAWTKQSGPTATITNASNATVSLSDLVEGVYIFRLTVTDDDGATGFDEATVTVSAANQAPVANAGSDKTVKLPTNSTSLNGGGSDADGSVVAYAWTKQSGPAANMANANTATLSLTGLVEGTYVFRLTVTDDDGATGTDYATVTVEAANQAPTANAGSDKTVVLPTNSTTLAGSGSDADGSVASYSWTKVSGPAATQAGQTTPTLSLTNLVEGTYVFRLTVTDNEGATDTDDVSVIVLPASVNQSPTVSAGADITLTLPTNSTNITGTASDPDGTVNVYLWEKLSGPTVTLGGTNTATLSLNNLVEGIYSFRITVTDNDGATASDDVKVTVTAVNQNPVVSAGSDQTLVLPTDNTSVTATASDPDGSIASYTWSRQSGPAATESGAATSTLTLTNLLEGTYVYRVTVTDNDGGSAFDDVKIVVQSAANSNPTANAGSDLTIYLPTSSTNIPGAGTDTDGTIASYGWVQISGPAAATLTNENTKTVTVSNLVAGTYVFQLTVTDDDGATGFDNVSVTVVPGTSNQPPIAEAGPNISITLPVNTTNLIGSGTDLDGSIASYNWFKVSGPAATMTNNTTAVLSLTNLVEGVYTFRLTVTDNQGATATDLAQVTILPASINQSPAVDAGNDITISLPTNSANLIAQASDPDGTIVSYSWTKQVGPTVTSSGETSASFSLQDLVEGVYVFQVVVTDDDGATASDEVTVTVLPVGQNQPPVANAGSDKLLFLPSDVVNLTGSGSDADGTIASYDWNIQQGPGATLTNATSSTVTVSNLVAGQYIFRFTVFDDDGASSFDEVTVTVFPGTVNQPPIANAGANQTIVQPNMNATIAGSGYDPDGSIVSYAWTQTLGTSATLDDVNSPTLNVSGLALGVSEFQLTVEDNMGATGSDIVQITVVDETAEQPPIANAGFDQIIYLPQNSVTIQGTGTDLDGSITNYQWQKKSGPAATIGGGNTPQLSLSDLLEGIYKFTLTVTDNDGLKNQDEVTVTVIPASVNNNPIVSAGADVYLRLPANSTSITATATDNDGFVASYTWTKQSGPATVTPSGETTATLTLAGLVEGTYVYSISVTDDMGAVSSDEVKIVVIPPGVNEPPLVTAGPVKTISLPTISATLNGSASDADGTIISIAWTQESGPSAASLSGQNSTTLMAGNLEIGTYTFRLTATDNESATAFSETTITVTDFNELPVVFAGNDTTLTLPENFLSFANATVDDPDGEIIEADWAQVSGAPADLAGEYPDVSAVNLEPGRYSFRLTAIDNLGGEAYDDLLVTVLEGANPLGADILLTPNGDAIHEFWVVKNLNLVENCPVKIFNRMGRKVYESDNYPNNWDGRVNGQPLEAGDYYYVFNCGNKKYSGAFRLIR